MPLAEDLGTGITNETLLSRFREFLQTIDIGLPDWRDVTEKYLKAELSSLFPRRSSRPSFSIGDDADDTSSDSIITTSPEYCDASTQCELVGPAPEGKVTVTHDGSLDEISRAWKSGREVRPGDALRLLNRSLIKHRELESRFDSVDAINIRRTFLESKQRFSLEELPFRNYDYKYVVNSCCENVLGYIPIPIGVAGPLLIQGRNGMTKEVYVPMATTEGALIASTNRGCSVIMASSGVRSMTHEAKMTRAPVVEFPSAEDAINLKEWLEERENFDKIKSAFDGTSRFANLLRIDIVINGNEAFLRFCAKTGDAMGMNMVSKACSAAMRLLGELFPDMRVIALSGNFCVDKKAAALNWIDGRGRSVVAECVVPAKVVSSVLKTTPEQMEKAAKAKLLHGSSMAGCVGGNNAHAANIVAAVFIATGQDAAQVVSSSMCTTRMETTSNGDLYVSCSMPCLEVGTVGGGTILRPQNQCLQMLAAAGPHPTKPGANANFLAEVICATVVAGELSLMAALVNDELVSSHLKLNRDNESNANAVIEVFNDRIRVMMLLGRENMCRATLLITSIMQFPQETRSRLELYKVDAPAPNPFPEIQRREHFRVKRSSERRDTCSNIL